MTNRAKRELIVAHARRDGMPSRQLAALLGVSRQRAAQLLAPERHHARRAVQKAVKRGSIVRPLTCERCGAGSPQAHHANYEDRFAVRWLCVLCHRRADWIEGKVHAHAR